MTNKSITLNAQDTLTVQGTHYDKDMGMTEYDILLNGKKIGFVEAFKSLHYIQSIGIDEDYRNNGYGTQVLKWFANTQDCVYICPDNGDAERLYERLGDEISQIPENLLGEYWQWGVMYEIYKD